MLANGPFHINPPWVFYGVKGHVTRSSRVSMNSAHQENSNAIPHVGVEWWEESYKSNYNPAYQNFSDSSLYLFSVLGRKTYTPCIRTLYWWCKMAWKSSITSWRCSLVSFTFMVKTFISLTHSISLERNRFKIFVHFVS